MGLGLAVGSVVAGEAVNRISGALRKKPKVRKINEGRLASLSSARAATQNALTQSNIKQAGAANRLPAGALSAALSNAGVKSPLSDPGFETARLGVEQFNIGQENRVEGLNAQEFDSSRNFSLRGLGTLSKIALLAKMGLLSPEGQADESDKGKNDNFALDPDQLQSVLAAGY